MNILNFTYKNKIIFGPTTSYLKYKIEYFERINKKWKKVEIIQLNP